MRRTDPDDGQADAIFSGFQGEGGAGGAAGELTAAQLATKQGIHQTMVGAGKRQAMKGLSGVFSGKAAGQDIARTAEADVEKLHAKIGQLLVERYFFGRSVRSMSLDRRRQMIEPGHGQLSVMRQCELVSISRSGFYGRLSGRRY